MQNLDTALAAGGRFLIAALFLLSGVGKIAAPAMIQGYIASAGLPAPLLVYLIAIIVEVGGGLSLLVGFQTRIVALILAAFTLAAALAFHDKFADPSEMIHFFKDLAIIGGLLQLAAFGPGSVSLDARRLNFAHRDRRANERLETIDVGVGMFGETARCVSETIVTAHR
jgi:putative oxidoreductase